MKITIGIVDDQHLFLKSLASLIKNFPAFDVVIEADNGKDLGHKLETSAIQPDIMLVDVRMDVMNGPETVKYLGSKFPSIKAVALSTADSDTAVLSMIRAGCCAYLLKDIHPEELEQALIEVHTNGIYNGDSTNIKYRKLLAKARDKEPLVVSQREQEFLKLACSDMTYKEIAKKMILSERTIDGYRDSLFVKFSVKSRVGMVIEALRENLIVI